MEGLSRKVPPWSVTARPSAPRSMEAVGDSSERRRGLLPRLTVGPVPREPSRQAPHQACETSHWELAGRGGSPRPRMTQQRILPASLDAGWSQESAHPRSHSNRLNGAPCTAGGQLLLHWSSRDPQVRAPQAHPKLTKPRGKKMPQARARRSRRDRETSEEPWVRLQGRDKEMSMFK